MSPEKKPIRVMVVDDHAVVRSGLRYFMLSLDDIELVGEASTGDQALEMVSSARPDVVLMDLVMPGMDGLETTRWLQTHHPEIRVLALTSFGEGDRVQEALRAGAVGYLLKDATVDNLADAIRAAHAGRSTLAPEAAQALVQATMAEKETPKYDLTERQIEVLALLVEGLSNAEIAQRLIISMATVRYHVSGILERMDASNRAEAAALAVKHGLV